MGHFHKSPYSLSHAVILDGLLWVRSNTWVDFRLHLTQSPTFSTRSTHYPKCNRALRVKQQQAESPQPIISSLSGLAKQGDSFFFLSFFNHHALLIRKELESPFCWRKVGNRSTNLQILKNSVKWILFVLLLEFCFTRETSSGTEIQNGETLNGGH